MPGGRHITLANNFWATRSSLKPRGERKQGLLPPNRLAKKVTFLSQWPLIHRPSGEPGRTFVYAALGFDKIHKGLSIRLKLLGVAKHP